MVLSFNKLDKFLKSKGFICKNYFVIDSACIYIEIFNINTADSIMLYIPSKYEIKVDSDTNNVYNVKFIDIDENDTNMLENFKKNEDDVDKYYDEVNVNFSPENKNEDLESKLKDNYNRPINLKKKTLETFKDIFRQLNRLKLCVQKLNYKLCIINENYVCFIKKDNSLDCLQVKEYNSNNMKMMVSIDLETLYSKIGCLNQDITLLQNSVYKILNNSQIKHINMLNSMIEKVNNINQQTNDVTLKKEQINNSISELEILLNKIQTSETFLYEKIMNINDKYDSDSTLKGLHTDIERTHMISKLENELKELQTVKQEIFKNLINYKIEQQNIMLSIDQILFDNSIMINQLINNFKLLHELV
jgi:hypothetical protein